MANSNEHNRALRRVVITGLGAVTPLGTDVPTSWQAALRGDNGIDGIQCFDASALPCRIAGEVKEDFQPLDYIDKKEVKRMDRFVQFALASADMAVADAEMRFTPDESQRYGCLLGVGLGGMATFERNHESLLRYGSAARFSLLRPHADRQHGGRARLHALWTAGSEFVRVHGVRSRYARHWRFLQNHSTWRRGRDAERGLRVRCHTARGWRFLRHARPFYP